MAQKSGVVFFLLISVSWVASKDLSSLLSQLSKGSNGGKPLILVLDNDQDDRDDSSVESPNNLLSKLAHVQNHRQNFPDYTNNNKRPLKNLQNRQSHQNDRQNHRHRTNLNNRPKYRVQNYRNTNNRNNRGQRKYKYINDFDLNSQERDVIQDYDYTDVLPKSRYPKKHGGNEKDRRGSKRWPKKNRQYGHRHSDHHRNRYRVQEQDYSEYYEDKQRNDHYDVQSPIVKSLLRISTNLQCGAQDECKDECGAKFDDKPKKADACENKCEQKFECPKKEDHECDNKSVCEASEENCQQGDGNPSTRGVPWEEEKTSCKRCKK